MKKNTLTTGDAATRTVRGALERRLLFMCLLLAATGALLIIQLPSHIAAMEEQSQYNSELHEFSELFAEVYQQIRTRYVEEVDSKTLFEGAINGMMATLDPHSSYMPPVQQKQLERDTEGEYSGVGLVITLRDQILTVISPLPGSPAAAEGVLPWDRIIEIDGETTKDITIHEAVEKLTGPDGSKVSVKVWREGESEPLEFTITRKTIHIDSVFSDVIEPNIGYLRISKFQDDTADKVEEVLESFNDRGVRGIIVDLRNNAGGLLDRAVEVCDLFLPEGQLIVSINGRTPTDNRKYFALEDQLARQPLVVLVNKGSASASEIFAGAMQDTHRGVIIGPEGTTTFGKGSVQTITALRNSLEASATGQIQPSGLRLTTARYYTPSGTSIHEKGISPDIGVNLPPNHERELMLHGGLLGEPEITEPGEAAPDSEPEEAPDAPDSDSLIDQLSHRDEPEKKDEFRDIMLDEAAKILKAMLIVESNRVAQGLSLGAFIFEGNPVGAAVGDRRPTL